MKQVRIKAGSQFFIKGGPSALTLEHSLFCEQGDFEARKAARFSIGEIPALIDTRRDSIMKYDDITTKRTCAVVIIAAIRANPNDPICNDWVLWGLDGGAKMILHYSTASRTGCGKTVDEFPEY